MIYQNYFNQLKMAIPLLMKEKNIPGFSISVCDKEKIIFSDTYGYTDLSENIPVAATTQFSLQSFQRPIPHLASCLPYRTVKFY